MKPILVFGVSAGMSLFGSAVLAWLVVWPWLQRQERNLALEALVAPHALLRFVGLSFLIPGVVSPTLAAGFAEPAAYGDLVAGILAIVSLVALAKHLPWRVPMLWAFCLWGTADLLFAFYQGPHLHIRPEALGAAFFIPTAIVPPLLVTHFLIFRLLVGKDRR